jgi:hypothetical protein
LKIKDRTLTLWAEQENETTTLASVPQRQAEKDPTKKIGWHTGMKKFLIQMQQGSTTQKDATQVFQFRSTQGLHSNTEVTVLPPSFDSN